MLPCIPGTATDMTTYQNIVTINKQFKYKDSEI